MYFCTHLSYTPEHGGPFSSNSGFQITGMRTSSTRFLRVSSSQEQPATAQQHLESSWSGGETQQPTLAPGSHPAQLLQAVIAE